MILTSVSIKKPVMMTMVIAAVLIFGIVAFLGLPIDLMPDIEFPFVTIQAIYMGAGPEEIETSVIKPIEEQMSTVSDVKSITSFCSEGIGFVLIEFNLGVDADLAAIDVKDKIDAILYTLPRDLLKPVIGKFDINAQPILNLALTGPQPPEVLRRMADKTVKDRLVRIGGVASVAVVGGREREIHVDLDKNKLDGAGLSVQMIAGMIAAQTADIPGGHISGDRVEYTVRVQGQFENLDQIADIRIPVTGGGGPNGPQMSQVKLSALGAVTDAYKEVREAARFNGQTSVGLSILKRPGSNTVAVAKGVLAELARINDDLPQGTKLSVAQDRSEFIEKSVNSMYSNILVGVLLTALMLFLFLSDWRVTLIAALTIPASIIGTFMGMQWLGFSLNFMTLMALAISVGMLVTNSIIVLENIVRHRDEGLPVREAAQKGADEVFVAVIASALTNIAVFVPMATMQGITGQFFKALGMTIVIATVVSLFLSFTLAPMMASVMLKAAGGQKSRGNWFEQALDRFHRTVTAVIDGMRAAYARLLSLALGHRFVTVGGTFLAFAGTLFLVFVGPAMKLTPRMVGTDFFPSVDQGIMEIAVEMPSGTSIDETNRVLGTIERRLGGIGEIHTVYMSLGGSGTASGVNYGNLVVRLTDAKKRTRTTREVIGTIRPLLADIPDAKIVVKETSMFGGGRSEADIQVEVTGDDMREILALADSVAALARGVPGLTDVQLSWKQAKPEIKFVPDRLKLDEYGMTVGQMGFALRNAMTGSEAAVYREANDEFKIRVQYDEGDRSSIDAVENISIQTPKGLVPIKALCDVKFEGGAANVNRKNRQRQVIVSANVAAGSVGTKAAELKKITDDITVPAGYRIYYGGQQEMMAESFGTLGATLLLAVILTFMVLAAILESLTQPVLIMMTIPLGLIGVLWALVITGNSISMISIMSFIMLVGVVVNNAILIIDYAHQLQKRGMTRRAAIYEACKIKFDAVLMMNLAIIMASLPQALEAESVQAPFAISAIGGIVVSTVLTLLVIPAMYAGRDDGSRKAPGSHR